MGGRTGSVAVLLAAAVLAPRVRAARADETDPNWLFGPVLGFALGGGVDQSRWRRPAPSKEPPPRRGSFLLGVEGGAGIGPQRINVGLVHRDGEALGYLELDPWLFIGASLGIGHADASGWHPVIGIWEGVPLTDPTGPDDEHHLMITIAAGLRYTGVLEFYVTPKIGSAPTYDFGH
jgi:hypothetical protein